MKAALRAPEILFSKEDKKKIDSMKLSMGDYYKLLTTAMDLCVGNDPDEKKTE